MTAHALLSASGMHRWAACPGSVNLAVRLRHDGLVVDRTNSYAIEGSAAHELGERCLRNGVDAASFEGQWLQTETDHPVQVTAEMAEHVQTYLDYVRSLASTSTPGDARYFIEQTFDLSQFYQGLFGTADCVCFDIPTLTLHVVDLKYGQGVAVEAEGNPQLRYYALGALVRLKQMNLPPPHPERIRMTIVQPRAHHPAGPVRSQELLAMELLMWSQELVEAAMATERLDAPLVAGDHCRFCPAAPHCPKLLELAQEQAQLAFKPVQVLQREDISGPVPVHDLTHEQLRRALLAAEVLEPWFKELHGYAQELLETGQPIAGWKLVAKRARRTWRGTPAETVAGLQLLGLPLDELYEPRELKSPAQVEKLLPSKERSSLNGLVLKESSGLVLVNDDDPRPAVMPQLPFKQIPQLEQTQ